jgi:hypothetical protein
MKVFAKYTRSENTFLFSLTCTLTLTKSGESKVSVNFPQCVVIERCGVPFWLYRLFSTIESLGFSKDSSIGKCFIT